MLSRLATLPPALRQTLLYALSLALAKGVSLLMIPVVTRFLEPADYGRLDVLQTLADLLSIVIGLGLADTLFRFGGSAKDETERRRVVATLYGLALLVGATALAVTQLFAERLTALLPGGVTETQTRLILASLSYSGIILIPLAWMRMQNRAGLYLLGSAGRAVAQAGLAAGLLVLGFGVTGFLVAGFVTATLLAVGLGWWLLRETGIRFDGPRSRGYLIYGGPLIATGMAGFVLGSFDRLILAGAVDPVELAHYALAAKFGLITAILVQPFDMWWLPRRFQVLGEAGGAARSARIVGFGIGLVVLAAVLVAATAPTVIRIATPESYHGAIAYVPWLVVLAAVHAATTLLGFGCYTGRSTHWPLIIDGSAALVAFGGYVVLIPAHGAWGAIAATAVALGGRLIAALLVSQARTPLPYAFRDMLLLATAGLLVIGGGSRISGVMAEGVLGGLGLLGLVGLGWALGMVPGLSALRKAR